MILIEDPSPVKRARTYGKSVINALDHLAGRGLVFSRAMLSTEGTGEILVTTDPEQVERWAKRLAEYGPIGRVEPFRVIGKVGGVVVEVRA